MEVRALVTQPKKTWVEFLDTEVLLEFLSVDELDAIRKNNTTYTFQSSRGQSGKIEKTDSEGLVLELGEKAVKDWKGITLEGKPLPFTPENRDLLMTKWPQFSSFVAEASTDIAVFAEKERESDEKKSSGTSGSG